jgi:hypothetical protein
LVEADFQRFYQINLTDEFERIELRRLMALVNGLPRDAATWREEREEAERWTQTDELLAVMIEVTDMWSHLIFKAAGGKLRKPHKPIQVRRPWERERNRISLSDQDAIKRFFSMN